MEREEREKMRRRDGEGRGRVESAVCRPAIITINTVLVPLVLSYVHVGNCNIVYTR